MSSTSGEQRQQIHELFEQHAEHMRNVALAGTNKDDQLAWAAVQETFHDAWKRRSSFLSLSAEHQRRWLFRVLHRKVANTFSRGAGRFERPADDTDLELAGGKPRPAASLRGVLLRELLIQSWAVIAEMPPRRRKIFFLRADEWTITEIAEELSIDESTVREHVRAGLKQLTAKVGPAREIFIDLEDGDENGTER
ncbi:RNA polymerase sigma factor [Actinoplanes sp. NPDC049548]|uniref:RNA polymerase sigma factor n=1 Tax=Actinoplanes sp. NPDC049548 TaxID=3155152 RepID=UPI00341996EA